MVSAARWSRAENDEDSDAELLKVARDEEDDEDDDSGSGSTSDEDQYIEDSATCESHVLMPSCGCYVLAVAGAAILSLTYGHITHNPISHQPWMYMLPWEILAWIAAIIATLNSCHHICQHLRFNTNSSELRSTVLPILLVVPVYAICSALALTAEQSSSNVAVLLNAFREFYEGIVLVAFMQFIAEFWGGAVCLASKVATDDMILKNVVPGIAGKLDTWVKACCVRHSIKNMRVFPLQRAPGSEYVGWSFVGVLQYSFNMWLLLLVNCVLWIMSDEDHELSGIAFIGHITPHMMMKGIQASSNLWAMYNLLIMFEYLRESKETEERMNRIKPVHKFACIKLIVLFSLWQEAALRALAKSGMLPTMFGLSATWEDQHKQADAAINFLVCVEMLMFAQWHRHAYPYDENWQGPQPRKHYRPPVLLSCLRELCPPAKMVDDIGYLLLERVPGQKRAVSLLEEATHEELISADGELARRLFKEFEYFDLDDNGEAGLAQIHIVLVRSGLLDWQQARDMCVECDLDHNARISYSEFIALTRTMPKRS